ncbi:DUF3140 domain-containing protein [Amycolatopsis jiangsuensis]|uniref:DUF3140 domain-containing protein n=1 Tax=Amycolatopsis jiangsuensis TaxID=1181879 RepID=A0A840J6S5_9PSEU|nr:DUF3140 domain-containing protein [Amycolatopsis jiangsuensis]MBB4689104.1 hypothetical protein [Amycolatopsis jiangsuensis]
MDEELWADFHRVVNMTSRELADWLRTREAGTDEEPLPDQAGSPTGHQVLAVLGKRKSDVDEHDEALMRRVVERVRETRRDDLEPVAGEAHWRRRLMSLGHDPLKPPA